MELTQSPVPATFGNAHRPSTALAYEASPGKTFEESCVLVVSAQGHPLGTLGYFLLGQTGVQTLICQGTVERPNSPSMAPPVPLLLTGCHCVSPRVGPGKWRVNHLRLWFSVWKSLASFFRCPGRAPTSSTATVGCVDGVLGHRLTPVFIVMTSLTPY